MKKSVKMIGIALCMICAAVMANVALAYDGTYVSMTTKLIGNDKVPCTIYTIRKTPDMGDMLFWLKSNYTPDQSSQVFYFPQTLFYLNIGHDNALAFKTWEHLDFVQNLLIDNGDSLTLYSTPHGEYNPDGAVVFGKLFPDNVPAIPKADLKAPEFPDQSQDAVETEQPESDLRKSISGKRACNNKCASNVVVGQVNGVSAYSNGQFSGTGGVCGLNYVSGYCTGYKWQCVEFVNRYFFSKFNKKISGGNANSYYTNASSKGLNRASNGGTDKPQAGNLLCSAGGSYGHVAIVKEVGSNYVKVVDQNWTCSSSERTLNLTVTTKSGKKYYTVSGFSGSYPVQGWLWPK